jgi:preprotein translocase subunit SecG
MFAVLMSIVKFLLVFIEILCSFLLIVAILLQKTKGQGTGLAFGAGMGETLFGSQAGNFMTRFTVVVAAIFLANTTLLAMIGTRHATSSVTDKIPSAPPSPPVSAPAMPGPSTPAGGDTMPAPDFGPIRAQPAAPAPEQGTAPATPAPVTPAPATPAPAPAAP